MTTSEKGVEFQRILPGKENEDGKVELSIELEISDIWYSVEGEAVKRNQVSTLNSSNQLEQETTQKFIAGNIRMSSIKISSEKLSVDQKWSERDNLKAKEKIPFNNNK